ncbi:MAG: hypothetical protein PUD26_08625 [bacterium]|nr:hypothetical protein [bacterium]
MARFISLCIFSMVTIVALTKSFNDSIPTSDSVVTITSKELALTFNNLVRYYESKNAISPFSIVDDESALHDYIIEDMLVENSYIEFSDINMDRGIYSVMHRGCSNPDVYILICNKKRLDVFNISRSDKSRLDALNCIYRLESQDEFEIEYWQFKKIVCKLLIYNKGRKMYYSPSRKFEIFNLHER